MSARERKNGVDVKKKEEREKETEEKCKDNRFKI
jgi:hypothetical protein